MKTFSTVDEYVAALRGEARERLESLRKAIKQAEEVIHYNMPAFTSNGMLVWYAALKDHIGFYPRASAMTAFKSELASYKTSKGAFQFPIKKGIPVGLVRKIVKFRLQENELKSKGKKQSP